MANFQEGAICMGYRLLSTPSSAHVVSVTPNSLVPLFPSPFSTIFRSSQESFPKQTRDCHPFSVAIKLQITAGPTVVSKLLRHSYYQYSQMESDRQ